MGEFSIQIRAFGGHGCQREKKSGEIVEDCGVENCLDCLARRFVEKLKAAGCTVNEALLVHWPNAPGPADNGRTATVLDNLIAKQRAGTF